MPVERKQNKKPKKAMTDAAKARLREHGLRRKKISRLERLRQDLLAIETDLSESLLENAPIPPSLLKRKVELTEKIIKMKRELAQE
jgi:hypothetical protein